MNNKLKLSLLSAASVLALAACGNSSQDSATESQQEPAQETTETTDQSAEETADQAPEETLEESETNQSDDTSDQASDDQTADTPGIESMDFAVSLQDATEAFKAEVGDDAVEITEVQFDTEDDLYVYEFTGFSNGTEYDTKIDAQTGDVVESESEADDLDDEVLDLTNVVEPQEAMDAALEAAGSGYVTGWELDVENGVAVYDIDLENANDVKVNAETGEAF